MTVTQLRVELERLEAAGRGGDRLEWTDGYDQYAVVGDVVCPDAAFPVVVFDFTASVELTEA